MSSPISDFFHRPVAYILHTFPASQLPYGAKIRKSNVSIKSNRFVIFSRLCLFLCVLLRGVTRWEYIIIILCVLGMRPYALFCFAHVLQEAQAVISIKPHPQCSPQHSRHDHSRHDQASPQYIALHCQCGIALAVWHCIDYWTEDR